MSSFIRIRGLYLLQSDHHGDRISIPFFILAQAMMAMDTAGKLLGSFDPQGNKRENIGLMKLATHLNRAAVEAGRLMILVAPEGLDKSIFDAAISQASDEAEKLEIAAITAEAALEDSK